MSNPVGPEKVVITSSHPRMWNIHLPIVYRYLPKKYVKAFFDDGSIRLSSFQQFAKHADEARCDPHEGHAHLMAIGANRHFGAYTEPSNNNMYTMCGSTVLSLSVMEQFSGCDACIAIYNVSAFGTEIGFRLAGYQAGLDGACTYKSQRNLVAEFDGEPLSLDEYKGKDVPKEHMMEIINKIHPDQHLFLKELKHASQLEHRLFWFMDNSIDPLIDIKAPKAAQYCRPIYYEEIAAS